MSNYKPIKFLAGQTLKAEDLNRLQDWIYQVSKDVDSIKQDQTTVKFPIQRNIAQVAYSDFEYNKGVYEVVNGKIQITKRNNMCHSQLLLLKPGATHYLGYVPETSRAGCFFDQNKKPTRVVKAEAVASTGKLVYMYKITPKANEKYFCFNIGKANDGARYRQFLCSKNMLMMNGSGNYVIYEDDPVYQQKKDKKLLVIGASGVSKNRTVEDGKLFIAFHEYLKLWYKSVDQFAWGGNSWRPKRSGKNIPLKIVGKEKGKGKNVKPYDEFLIIPSTAGIKFKQKHLDRNKTKEGHAVAVVGNYNDSISTLEKKSGTYFQGLNYVISYINKQRKGKFTKIYLANVTHKGPYYNSNSKLGSNVAMDRVNTEMRKLCDANSYEYIDVASKMGINNTNEGKGILTSDGTHLNALGNYLQGMCIRKEIIGI